MNGRGANAARPRQPDAFLPVVAGATYVSPLRFNARGNPTHITLCCHDYRDAKRILCRVLHNYTALPE